MTGNISITSGESARLDTRANCMLDEIFRTEIRSRGKKRTPKFYIDIGGGSPSNLPNVSGRTP